MKSRGRAVVAHECHALEVVGSNPTPATILVGILEGGNNENNGRTRHSIT